MSQCCSSELPGSDLEPIEPSAETNPRGQVGHGELERFEPLNVWQFVFVALHKETDCLGPTLDDFSF